jgi:hypothetical protein
LFDGVTDTAMGTSAICFAMRRGSMRRAVDPQDRGRQYIASQLEKLAGTRLAGFVFTRQAPAGKWGAATYALKKTGTAEEHRDHRGHRANDPDAPDGEDGHTRNGDVPAACQIPMTPVPPMLLPTTAKSVPNWRKQS